ncbi:MAG: ACP phosphodiesterase [Pseudomonadota bacterium]
MNWLAHIVLSRRDAAYQLGNVLADPLRGRAWPGAPSAVIDGMSMHQAIDKFTDAHPQIAVSKSRLGERGLLRGVAVDVIYDHFLFLRWDRHVRLPVDVFLEKFHQDASLIATSMPDRAKTFTERLIRSELLSSYANKEGVAQALLRVDSRLSVRLKARETTSQYFDAFVAEYDSLQADFDQFFPDLVAFFDWHPLGGLVNSNLRDLRL